MSRPADLIFPDRVAAAAERRCVEEPYGCGKSYTNKQMEKWSDIETREYSISLLCKECQDKVFGPDPDLEDVPDDER